LLEILVGACAIPESRHIELIEREVAAMPPIRKHPGLRCSLPLDAVRRQGLSHQAYDSTQSAIHAALKKLLD
jgi:hypothetical protein